jgi:hypothetical protein
MHPEEDAKMYISAAVLKRPTVQAKETYCTYT